MLSLQNMATLLASMAAAAQGALPGGILNLAPGSIFLAIHQSFASVLLWLQWQLVLVWLQIRAATSTGSALDTWMADFGVIREPPAPASGAVTFSRFTATASATVQPGATVLTGDQSQTFAVTVDTTNAYYVPEAGYYLIPAGVTSATLPVQAVVPGIGGNVLAGTIALVGTALPGIDTVTNAAAFTNGTPAETDAALRARFVAFINTRSLATLPAVQAAILGVQPGLIFSVFENVASNGAAQPGNFVAVVDDGSGSPPATLLASVSTAIAGVRPTCATWAVVGPTPDLATVAVTLTPPPGTTVASVTPGVQTAITTYIDTLPINNAVTGTTSAATLFLAQLAGIASAAAPSGTLVTAITINGGIANLVPANMGAVRCAGVTVT